MKQNKILYIFLIIGILFAGILVFNRVSVERGYKNYDVILDFDEILKLTDSSKHSAEYYLKEFKKIGINYVGVNEATVNSLSKRKEFKIQTSLDGYNLKITANKDIIEFMKDGFSRKIGASKVKQVNEKTLIIKAKESDYIFDKTKLRDDKGDIVGEKIIAESSKLEYLGIGYLPLDLKLVKKSGLTPMPRPLFQSKYENASKSLDRYFQLLDKEDIKLNYILFGGKEVLGGKKELSSLEKNLKENNIIPVMIESLVQRKSVDQKGMDELVTSMDYQATRAFNIWDYIQKRYDYEIPMHHNGEEIMNSMYRAITERNIRVIYFRPFIDKDGSYIDDMSIYSKRFSEFEKRMKMHGFKWDSKIVPMKANHPNRFLQIPIIIGILASAFLLLQKLFGLKNSIIYKLFGAFSICFSALYFLGKKVDVLNKLFALLGTMVMPSLAVMLLLSMIFQIQKSAKIKDIKIKSILWESLVLMLFLNMISFSGALFETSLLSDSKFLLEMDLFRGVKISQLMPLGITLFIYLMYFGYKRKDEKKGIRISEILNLFKENIKVGHLIVLSIVLGAGVIYVARMGHETNIQPSMFEIFMRNVLDVICMARPRTKSFLLANPAIVLLIYMAYKKQKWTIFPLAFVAAIGQGDIVNTFSHLRTPIYLSTYRLFYEIIFGLFIGIAVVFIINLFVKLLERRKLNG